MKNIALYTTIIMFLWLLPYCNFTKTHPRKTFKISELIAKSPSTSQITIENRGSENAHFSMKLNDGFYQSLNEIADEVRKMPFEYNGEPIERKAWRYVAKNVKFSKALTSENWQHAPALMINSVGNGICDDLSSTLHIIWKNLGLKSRVWGLDGHVVAEVFTNGKWHMYDPSHQTYYLNSSNEVASVEELSNHPELITEPIGGVKIEDGTTVAYALAHSQKMANTYSSISNNKVNDWYNIEFNLADTLFQLPAGAKMKFPVTREYSQSENCNSFTSDYSFLSVEITGKEIAEVSAPLVLYAIEGTGTISIDNKRFKINSDDLNKYLNDFSSFHQHVTILGKNTNATAFYLLNKRSISINRSNSLWVGGYNVQGLYTTIEEDKTASKKTNSSINLDSVIKEKFTAYNKARGQRLSQTTKLFALKTDAESMAERAAFIISLDNQLNSEQKKQKLLFTNKKIDALLIKLASNKKRERIIEALSNPYLFIVLLTYIEYCNEQELANMLS